MPTEKENERDIEVFIINNLCLRYVVLPRIEFEIVNQVLIIQVLQKICILFKEVCTR